MKVVLPLMLTSDVSTPMTPVDIMTKQRWVGGLSIKCRGGRDFTESKHAPTRSMYMASTADHVPYFTGVLRANTRGHTLKASVKRKRYSNDTMSSTHVSPVVRLCWCGV